MIKANIEIDNYTAMSISPVDGIHRYMLADDFVFISYDKKKRTAVYKNGYFTVTLKNMIQI